MSMHSDMEQNRKDSRDLGKLNLEREESLIAKIQSDEATKHLEAIDENVCMYVRMYVCLLICENNDLRHICVCVQPRDEPRYIRMRQQSTSRL